MGKDFRSMWFDTNEARVVITIHPDGLAMSAEELALVFKRGMGRHKKPTTVFVIDSEQLPPDGQLLVYQIIADATGGLCLSDIPCMVDAWTVAQLIAPR